MTVAVRLICTSCALSCSWTRKSCKGCRGVCLNDLNDLKDAKDLNESMTSYAASVDSTNLGGIKERKGYITKEHHSGGRVLGKVWHAH